MGRGGGRVRRVFPFVDPSLSVGKQNKNYFFSLSGIPLMKFHIVFHTNPLPIRLHFITYNTSALLTYNPSFPVAKRLSQENKGHIKMNWSINFPPEFD